jgi:hypothetical protein
VVATAPRPVSRTGAMDPTYSPEELAFQREVRAWLKCHVPARDRSDNPVEGAPDTQRISLQRGEVMVMPDNGAFGKLSPKRAFAAYLHLVL